MALHSRWVDGSLEFYDGGLKNLKIRGSTDALCFGSTGVGCLAKAYYVGTTGAAGCDADTTGSILKLTVVKGIVTVCTTT